MSHILLDKNDPGKVAGALGFSVRDNKIYVFKAKAVISSAGGATMVFRPHSVGEGLGRIWYAPWNTGSAYKLMINAGAEMTQMEHRLVVARFKDGYGPVGMWFLLFKAILKNGYGELVEEKWADLLKDWLPYGAGKPIPTPLRNHQMIQDHLAGNGPHYLRTDEALQKMYADVQNDPKKVREIEADAWEDFLDMTMSQALLWASENIDPAKTPSEVVLTEPYSHGIARVWHRRLGERSRGHRAEGLLLGLQPHDDGARALRRRRRCGRLGSQVLVGLLYRRAPGRQGRHRLHLRQRRGADDRSGPRGGHHDRADAALGGVGRVPGQRHSRRGESHRALAEAVAAETAEDHGRVRGRAGLRATSPTAPPSSVASSC